jgi:hypothetical protein
MRTPATQTNTPASDTPRPASDTSGTPASATQPIFGCGVAVGWFRNAGARDDPRFKPFKRELSRSGDIMSFIYDPRLPDSGYLTPVA